MICIPFLVLCLSTSQKQNSFLEYESQAYSLKTTALDETSVNSNSILVKLIRDGTFLPIDERK